MALRSWIDVFKDCIEHFHPIVVQCCDRLYIRPTLIFTKILNVLNCVSVCTCECEILTSVYQQITHILQDSYWIQHDRTWCFTNLIRDSCIILNHAWISKFNNQPIFHQFKIQIRILTSTNNLEYLDGHSSVSLMADL